VTVTLRLRLLLVLIGVVAAGLVVAAVATYFLLSSFLLGRFDSELDAAVAPLVNSLSHSQVSDGVLSPAFTRNGTDVFVEPGTFGQLRDPSGTVISSGFVPPIGATPLLPTPLPGGINTHSGTFFSVSSTGPNAVEYRAVAVGLVNAQGTVIVAIPLTNVHQTLGRLLIIEVAVSLIVLAGLGLVAWGLVRRELRPLDTMAASARAIAAGDLTQRVTPADDGTEVGVLGSALNTMLGEIEEAFAARTASEERLRRFLADASHELRTPLTSIRGYAEMFDRGLRDRPEDLAVSLHHIRNEADRMGIMVEDLLLLARLGRERPLAQDQVDLVHVVTGALDAARTVAPDRTFTLDAPDTVTVVGDGNRLRQVVDNLLANAIKHTPPATAVDVRLTVDHEDAVLQVRDHGPGIAMADRPRIFEPFFRADSSRTRSTGGAGLGLPIVSAIVAAHGGEVRVGGAAGGGAVFRVRLPTTPRPTDAPEQDETPAASSAGPPSGPQLASR
jgi:two-component system, OmpR family, sensor kinase